MMKILSVFSSHYEIIRQSQIIKNLDQHAEHLLAFVNQNSAPKIENEFFSELNLSMPGVFFETEEEEDEIVKISKSLIFFETLIKDFRPDKILVSGSGLNLFVALAASVHKIPVFYLGAGNSISEISSEKTNQKIINQFTTVFLCYSGRKKESLLENGINRRKIYVVGNPIKEVLENFESAESTNLLEKYKIEKFEYFFLSLESSVNLDSQTRSENIFKSLNSLIEIFEKRILIYAPGLKIDASSQISDAVKDKILFIEKNEKVNFASLLEIQKNALAVLTDNEMMQEICTVSGIPNVLLLDQTNNLETVECGSNIPASTNVDSIIEAVKLVISQPSNWLLPPDYKIENVAQIVSKIILSVDVAANDCLTDKNKEKSHS